MGRGNQCLKWKQSTNIGAMFCEHRAPVQSSVTHFFYGKKEWAFYDVSEQCDLVFG